MIETFNTIMSLALSLATTWAIMSHRVRDGIVIKAGLICVALGLFAAALIALDHGAAEPLAAAHALVHLGLLVCALGYLLRRRQHKQRGARGLHRLSDWVDLA